MAVFAILRAAWGYLFLIFLARIVGRRPGKQLTPFEFVLIFYLGGLTLTGIAGRDISFTNAVLQIMTVAGVHWIITALRVRSPQIAKILDGTPLILINAGQWREQTIRLMHITRSDVMTTARDQRVSTIENIDTAILERNGEINVMKQEQ
jgi:uncharacterized membrane protein YcaP (DUF421 family)